MKTLYLVRHAKAIPADVGVEDFKRALAKSGEQDAESVSKRLRKRGIRPDLLVSSPADRALETAHIFAKRLDYAVQQIRLQEALYVNTIVSFNTALRELDDAYATAMIFGHNPSISEVAQAFLPALDAELPTCGVVGIAFNSPSWQAISAETARLILFDFPIQHGTPEHKHVKKILRTNIMAALTTLLEQADPGVTDHLAKSIRKTSKRLAKEAVNLMSAAHIRQLTDITDVLKLPDNKPLSARRRGRKPVSASATSAPITPKRPRGRPAKKSAPDNISAVPSDGHTPL